MKESKSTLIFLSMLLAGLATIAPAMAAGEEAPALRSEMLVTTQWLADHLHDPDLVVLCIGSGPDFYNQGHIPGARNITMKDLTIARDGIPNELPPAEHLQAVFEAAGISNGSRVVLYGEHSGVFAARAYFTLDYLGVAGRAALLDGGLEKWKAEQRPVSTDAPEHAKGKLKIAVRPELVVDTAAMRAFTQKKPGSVAILDARSFPDYSGEKPSEDVPRAGHIPQASSVVWMDLIVSRENPVLKPEAELRRMFAAANARAGQPLATYCRTGMLASFDYFVARYLGYDPVLYDGSFYEWSRADLPVEKAKP